MKLCLFYAVACLLVGTLCRKCDMTLDFPDYAHMVYDGNTAFQTQKVGFEFRFSIPKALNNITSYDWEIHTVQDFEYKARQLQKGRTKNQVSLVFKPVKVYQKPITDLSVSIKLESQQNHKMSKEKLFIITNFFLKLFYFLKCFEH